ncbi:DNA-processing protein DprA [bacterium]|nr:DNA-processing protein DprA [candidate division CSSED10-310 bacterium]
MMEVDGRAYWLILTRLQGMTDRLILQLLEVFGDMESLFAAGERDLIKRGGLSPVKARRLAAISPRKLRQAQEGVLFLEDQDIGVTAYDSDDFPPQLRHIPDPPLLLFSRGVKEVEQRRTVAVIGSRTAGTAALAAARHAGRGLARAGYLVVSGLARGIDAEAHRGALDEGGGTLAVLGCGPEQADPPEHEELYHEIMRFGGGILSEYPPGTPPSARKYLRRNRITSGLSGAVLVVEARTKSGSYGTADAARRQHRPLLAMEWGEADETNLGNRRLIDEGLAVPISPEALDELPAVLNMVMQQSRGQRRLFGD